MFANRVAFAPQEGQIAWRGSGSVEVHPSLPKLRTYMALSTSGLISASPLLATGPTNGRGAPVYLTKQTYHSGKSGQGHAQDTNRCHIQGRARNTADTTCFANFFMTWSGGQIRGFAPCSTAEGEIHEEKSKRSREVQCLPASGRVCAQAAGICPPNPALDAWGST